MDELEKLYNGLIESGDYTKSFEDFKSKYSTTESISSLYKGLNSTGDYTKSKDEFVNKYFTVPEKKKIESKDTPLVSQNTELVSSEKKNIGTSESQNKPISDTSPTVNNLNNFNEENKKTDLEKQADNIGKDFVGQGIFENASKEDLDALNEFENLSTLSEDELLDIDKKIADNDVGFFGNVKNTIINTPTIGALGGNPFFNPNKVKKVTSKEELKAQKVAEKQNDFLDNLGEEKQGKLTNLKKVKGFREDSKRQLLEGDLNAIDNNLLAFESKLLGIDSQREKLKDLVGGIEKEVKTSGATTELRNQYDEILKQEALLIQQRERFSDEATNVFIKRADKLNELEDSDEKVGSIEQELGMLKRNYAFFDNIKSRVGLGFADLGANVKFQFDKAKLTEGRQVLKTILKNELTNDPSYSNQIPEKYKTNGYVFNEAEFDSETQQLKDNQLKSVFVGKNLLEAERNKLRPNISVEEINGLGDVWDFTVDGLADNVSTLTQLAIPYVGQAAFVIGQQSGNELEIRQDISRNQERLADINTQLKSDNIDAKLQEELINEKKSLDSKVKIQGGQSDANIFVASSAMALSELVFSRMFGEVKRIKVGKRILKDATKSELKRVASRNTKDRLKSFGESLISGGKEVGKDALEEGFLDEFLTNTTQNAISKFQLGNNDVGLFDNSIDAIGGGLSIGAVMSASPRITGSFLGHISDKKRRAKVFKNVTEISRFQKLLDESENLDDTSRATIQNNINTLLSQNTKLVNATIDGFDGMSKKNKENLLNIASESTSLEVSIDKLKEKASLTEEEQFLVKELESKLETLDSQKAEIVDKFDNPVVEEEVDDKKETTVTQETKDFAEELSTEETDVEDISQYVGGNLKISVGNTDIGIKSLDNGNIKIESIATTKGNKGEGSARKALQEATSVADNQGKTLELNVVPLSKDTTVEGLIKLYEEEGFVKDKDFDKEDGGRMIRLPETTQTFADIVAKEKSKDKEEVVKTTESKPNQESKPTVEKVQEVKKTPKKAKSIKITTPKKEVKAKTTEFKSGKNTFKVNLKDGVLEVTPKFGTRKPNASQVRDIKKQYAESTDFSKGELANFEGKGELTPQQITEVIVDESNNPQEIANRIVEVKESNTDNITQLETSKEDAIADALTASKVNDSNNDVTDISKGFLSGKNKTERTIDQIRELAQENLGQDVDNQDILNFIETYSSASDYKRKSRSGDSFSPTASLEDKFKELTGLKPTPKNIERIIGKNTESEQETKGNEDSEVPFQTESTQTKIKGKELSDLVSQLFKTGLAKAVKMLNNTQITAKLKQLGVDVQKQSEASEKGITIINPPAWKSTAKEGLSKLTNPKATAEQWVKTITDKGGKGTAQELEWIGLKDFLVDYAKSNNIKSIPKEVVEQYIEDNQIEIVEVTKQDKNTKFSQYTLEGGENYIEVLLTLPRKEKETVQERLAKFGLEWEYDMSGGGFVVDKDGEIVEYDNLPSEVKLIIDFATEDNARTFENNQIGDFKSSHFDESNILAHVRMNERTLPNGERVLFIEEAQSDWAQEGKKVGFDDENSLMLQRENIRKKLLKKERERFDLSSKDLDTTQIYAEIKTLNDELNAFDKANPTVGQEVANMPYKKTDQWVGMAMRRVMQMAVQEGFDRVAWVTGEQSADRYDLSKTIDEIRYEKNNDNTYNVNASKESGSVFYKKNMTLEDIESTFGKGIVETIIDGKGEVIENETAISGEGLKVGGEGMKTFYNSILPKVAKKEAQRFDKSAKVDVVDFRGTDKLNQQLSIKLTDKAREGLSTALPLFQKTDDGGQINGFVHDGVVYLNSDNVKGDTPIHEFGHLWNKLAKEKYNDVYKTGLDLIEDSPYHEAVKNNPAYEHLSPEGKLEEALAQAIGESGVELQKESKKKYDQFQAWFKDLFKKIAEGLGITTMSGTQLANLKLKDYTRLVSAELLSGKKIGEFDTKQPKAKIDTSENTGIDFLIDKSTAIKTLKDKIKKEKELTKAFVKDIQDEIINYINESLPKKIFKFVNPSERTKIINLVRKAKTEANLTKAMDSVNTLVEKLEGRLDAEKARILDIKNKNKDNKKHIREVRTFLKQYIQHAINFKRNNEKSKSELNKIVKVVSETESIEVLLKSIETIDAVALSIDNRITLKSINKLLDSKFSKKSSGRRKANITDEQAESTLNSIKENIRDIKDEDVSTPFKQTKTNKINERIANLIGLRETLILNNGDLLEVEVLNISIDILSALQTKDVNIENELLTNSLSQIKSIYDEGRSRLKDLREERKKSDAELLNSIREDINPNNKRSGKTVAEIETENKKGISQAIRRVFFNFFQGSVIGSLDSLSGLLSRKGGESRDSSALVQFVNKLKTQEIYKSRRIGLFSKIVTDSQKTLFGSNRKANAILNKKVDIDLLRHPNLDVNAPKEKINVTYTYSQLLNVWMNSKNDNLKAGLDSNGFTEDVINQIDNLLPQEVKDYGEVLFDVYEKLYEDSNDVYTRMNYHSLGKPEKYAGKVHRSSNTLKEDTDALLGGVSSINTTGYGSQKERITNSNPIEAIDVNKLIKQNIQESSHYVAFAEPHREFKKILEDEGVKKAIHLTNKSNGDLILKALNYYKVRDLEQGGDRGFPVLDFFGRNIAKAVLSLKAKIGFTQTISIINGSFDMPTGLGFTKFISYYNPVETIKTISYLMENSDFIKNRYGVEKASLKQFLLEGSIDEAVLGLNDLASQSEFAFSNSDLEAKRKAVARFYTKALNLGMINVKAGDFIGVMGTIPAYNAWLDKYRGQGLSENVAREKAMQKFEASADRSQQSISTFGKSKYQKHPIARYFMMFATSPIQNQQNANFHRRELTRGLKGEQKKGKNVRNAFAFINYQFAQPMLYTYIAGLMAGSLSTALGFGDEEPNDADKDLLRSAIMGNVNSVPILGGIAQLLIEQALGKEFTFGGIVSSALLDSTTKLQESWLKAFNAKTEASRVRHRNKAMKLTAGLLAGLPHFLFENIQAIDDIYWNDEIDNEVKFLKGFGYSDFVIEKARTKRKSRAKSKEEKDKIDAKYQKSIDAYEKQKNNTKSIFKSQGNTNTNTKSSETLIIK
tara:strand:- start:8545 stop:17787 length:9243 start_codon:yes stop_codon:yes gene_type:complete